MRDGWPGERVKCLREPGSRGGGVVAGATVGGWVRGVDVCVSVRV